MSTICLEQSVHNSHKYQKSTNRILTKKLIHLIIMLDHSAEVAEWQTRMVQDHVLARVWKFDSSLRHQNTTST